MTTNKPEVAMTLLGGEQLIRLTDYEALQAECDLLRKHLQNLIDQTTPLEPVPGDPMWSRRIQLDEVIAERDQLLAECEKLRRDASRYQWLRGNGAFAPSAWGNGWALACGSSRYSSVELDASVDTAMETTK